MRTALLAFDRSSVELVFRRYFSSVEHSSRGLGFPRHCLSVVLRVPGSMISLRMCTTFDILDFISTVHPVGNKTRLYGLSMKVTWWCVRAFVRGIVFSFVRSCVIQFALVSFYAVQIATLFTFTFAKLGRWCRQFARGRKVSVYDSLD